MVILRNDKIHIKRVYLIVLIGMELVPLVSVVVHRFNGKNKLNLDIYGILVIFLSDRRIMPV